MANVEAIAADSVAAIVERLIGKTPTKEEIAEALRMKKVMICSNPRRADCRFLFFQKWESDTSLLIDPRPPPPKKRDRKKNPGVRGGVKLSRGV